MSRVFVVGDGPLAYQLADLVEGAGHTAVRFLVDEQDDDLDSLGMLEEAIDRVDIAIEAIVGVRHYKTGVVRDIEMALHEQQTPVLVSTLNASTSEVQAQMVFPEMAVGWAALPPLDGSDVIEFMPGLRSDVWAIEAAREFLESLGKEPVRVNDTVGGVLPRVVANLVNEAAYALMEGVASAEDIDAAMQKGTNYPHGPLRWGDLIGLDQVYGILVALAEAYGPDRYRPAPLLRQLVEAAYWGQRTGRGFYTYP